MKNIFKEAHRLTQEIVEKYGDVDYSFQFSLCLKMLIEDNKKEESKKEEISMEKYLLGKGLKTWIGGTSRRIYIKNVNGIINNVSDLAATVRFIDNKKDGKKLAEGNAELTNLYYDCSNDTFYYTSKYEPCIELMAIIIREIRKQK